MKLKVEGIEEIEITDPSGLCDPPMPPLPRGNTPGLPPGVRPFPQPGAPWPTPQTPTPISPFSPQTPPPPYTRPAGDPLGPHTKWGVGGEAIQQAGQNLDKDKWEKNLQSKDNGEEHGDGNGNSHESG